MKLAILTYLMLIKNSLSNPLVCTVCTVAIASGLGISRMLGVSDNVIGIWLGAILLAISNSVVMFLKNKKNINNKILNSIIYISDYLMIIPLYLGDRPKILFNATKILFIDSFLFSVIIGSLVLFCSSKLYYYMKEKNNGKPHFQFEKVVLPMLNLIIVSIIFNYL